MATGPTKRARKPAAAAPAPAAQPAFDPERAETERALLAAALETVHRPRLTKMGPTASGLHDYYVGLLDSGRVPGPLEVQAMRQLLDELPAFDTYFVMQAGLGELALWLAMHGKRVVAHDTFLDRRQALQAGVDHLAGQGLIDPARFIVRSGLADPAREDGRCIGLGMHMIVGSDDSTLNSARSFARLDAMLLEPRTFLRLRSDGDSQDAGIAFLAELGLDRPRALPGSNYVFFERSRRLEPEDRVDRLNIPDAPSNRPEPPARPARPDDDWRPRTPRNAWERVLDWCGFL